MSVMSCTETPARHVSAGVFSWCLTGNPSLVSEVLTAIPGSMKSMLKCSPFDRLQTLNDFSCCYENGVGKQFYAELSDRCIWLTGFEVTYRGTLRFNGLPF